MRIIVFFIILFLPSLFSYGQTKKNIDSLKSYVLDHLDNYKCLEDVQKSENLEDIVIYDTTRFYVDNAGNLKYILHKRRRHFFHMMGDSRSFREFFFDRDSLLLEESFYYSFLDQEWDRHGSLEDEPIHVTSGQIKYYTYSGEGLKCYRSREAEGKFKDRYKLIEAIPLEEKRARLCKSPCWSCLEDQYLKTYRKLLKESKE